MGKLFGTDGIRGIVGENRRGGDGAQRHYVPSYGGNARDQRPLQHVRGDAGIHADGHKREKEQTWENYSEQTAFAALSAKI